MILDYVQAAKSAPLSLATNTKPIGQMMTVRIPMKRKNYYRPRQ